MVPWVGLSHGEFLPCPWTVLEKLWLLASVQDGDEGGGVIHASLAFSPKLAAVSKSRSRMTDPCQRPCKAVGRTWGCLVLCP